MNALLDWLLAHSRRIGQSLRAAALLGLLAGLAALLIEASLPRIATVRFTSHFKHLDNAALQTALEATLQGHYLNVDVEALQKQLLALPWVRAASVRKRWPDTLEIDVDEHEPLARWNETQVISREGAVFSPPAGSIPEGLPRLRGEQAALAAAALQSLQPLLVAAGLSAAELERDARGAISLRVSNGPWLLLGRERLEQRLARWLRVAPELAKAGIAAPERADLRYANGLALAAGGAG